MNSLLLALLVSAAQFSSYTPTPPGAGTWNDGGQSGQNIVPSYGQNDHTTAVSINPMLSDLTVGDRYSYGDGGGVCLVEHQK